MSEKDFQESIDKGLREGTLVSKVLPLNNPDDQLRKLATETIQHILWLDIERHNIGGSGDYEISDKAKDFIRRARSLGLGPLEPYEGYSYMSQVS